MSRSIEKMTFEEVFNALNYPCYPTGNHNTDGERYKTLLSKMDIVNELLEEIVIAGGAYDKDKYSIIANPAKQYLTELRYWFNNIVYLQKGEIEND